MYTYRVGWPLNYLFIVELFIMDLKLDEVVIVWVVRIVEWLSSLCCQSVQDVLLRRKRERDEVSQVWVNMQSI